MILNPIPATVLRTNQSVGVINDYNVGTLFPVTTIEWNGAADITIAGIVGGKTGYIFNFKNSSGAFLANFLNNSGLTTPGNQLTNIVQNGITPVAPGGYISYFYDGQNWQLLNHNQGLEIVVPFNAGDYTGGGGMTWTPDAADLKTFQYYVSGKLLKIIGYWDTTTVSGGQIQLFVAIPGGYTGSAIVQSPAAAFDNGIGTTAYNRVGVVNFTKIEIARADVANWAASINNTYIRVNIDIPIQ